jgi:hypothetical protein
MTSDAPSSFDAEATGALEIFEATCAAAGIAPGGERLTVRRALPPGCQDAIWADVASRVGAQHAASEEELER